MPPPPPAGGMPASARIRTGWQRLGAGFPFACGVAGTPQAIGAVSWVNAAPTGNFYRMTYGTKCTAGARG